MQCFETNAIGRIATILTQIRRKTNTTVKQFPAIEIRSKGIIVPDIFRQRRRFCVIAVFLIIAGGLQFWPAPEYAQLRLNAVVLAVIYGLSFALGLTAFGMTFPRYRFFAESIALSVLMLSTAAWVFQDVAQLFVERGLKTVLTAMILATAAHLVLFGRWSDRVFPRLTRTITGRTRTNLNKVSAWNALYPTPEHAAPEAFGKPVTEISYLEPGQPHLKLCVTRDGEMIEEHRHIEAMEPCQHVRYRWSMPHHRGLFGAIGTRDLRIDEKRRATTISSRYSIPDRPLRLVLSDWIDDSYGRSLDAMIARGTCDTGAQSGDMSPL